MSDEALTTCPSCKGQLRRLIGGGVGVIFKGSGFYVTDNREKSTGSASNNGNGAKAKGEGAPAKDAGATGEQKTKPEKTSGEKNKSTVSGSK